MDGWMSNYTIQKQGAQMKNWVTGATKTAQ